LKFLKLIKEKETSHQASEASLTCFISFFCAQQSNRCSIWDSSWFSATNSHIL